METMIKQSEEERNKALESAKQLYNEQMMLKQTIDVLRSSIGLEPMPDKFTENDEKLIYRLK